MKIKVEARTCKIVSKAANRSAHVIISPEKKVRIQTKVSRDCLNTISKNSRAGRIRSERDQHASLEFAGTRYSR